jgi:hypothetical protein
LTQSFLFALQQALNNENLNDIMPDTHFKASLNAIESWKADYPETYKRFLAELGTPIDDYIISLKEYSAEAYEAFIELYPKLTAGSTFNPFLGFDVVELYEKVVDKLSDKGYEGVYIIYDEFSKYLESSIGNATISDIKLLQDFAEKCARSGKKQMHLMLICHKDIANYIDNQLPKEKVDGWRGVSGRFKHTNLHNNFAQMYEIISAVIKKDSAFWDSYVAEHKAQFDELEKKYTTSGLIDKTSAEGVRSAIYGCYPLHPVSTFILPRLSEKVAQNEAVGEFTNMGVGFGTMAGVGGAVGGMVGGMMNDAMNSATAPAAPADGMATFKAKVEKLTMLKEAGMLSEEEFNAMKAKLLSEIL